MFYFSPSAYLYYEFGGKMIVKLQIYEYHVEIFGFV